ncbi:MAG: class I SAM-dependent methyltransferase [Maricaulaceae bacterium]
MSRVSGGGRSTPKTVLALGAILAANACEAGPSEAPTSETQPAETASATSSTPAPSEVPRVASLAEAVAGEWRSEADRARDPFRHPEQTLTFFGVEANQTVMEVWPGAGWYTQILAPYLASGGGQLIAASFDPSASAVAAQRHAQFVDDFSNTALYGDTRHVGLGPDALAPVEPNSVDVVVTFRNVHNWMAGGYADEMMAALFTALKPGGVLGVVEHRAAPDADFDLAAASGYAPQRYVRLIAEEAGFVFEAASEVNANPADTADHPFGVWTLPPVLRTAPRDAEPDPAFDTTPYQTIGESDRMTLKFVKPTG